MLTAREVKERVDCRFKCKTIRGKGPKPDKISVEVYGHHGSYCTDTHRIWGFESEAGRNRFLNDFGSAEPCE